MLPVFHAYAGTVREARDRPHSSRFDTDSDQIGIDTIASVCMSLSGDMHPEAKWSIPIQ